MAGGPKGGKRRGKRCKPASQRKSKRSKEVQPAERIRPLPRVRLPAADADDGIADERAGWIGVLFGDVEYGIWRL